jgi:regulator of protease activity HflC (stomatin/prohibitin superfamily)
MNNDVKFSAISILVLVIFTQLISFLIFDIVRVSERETAVITRFGQVQNVVSSGWHPKVPWIDSHAVTYDTSIQSVSAEASSATKDQQAVKIKVNVQYKLDGTKAKELYKNVKDQKYLNESIIPPFIQEAVKSSSSQYSATELLDKRDQFKVNVEEALQNRMKEYYANVVAVNVENIDWSDSFDQAIEAKVKAQQEVLAKEQELKKVEVDAKIKQTQAETDAKVKITQAESEAKALQIQGEAIRANPETIELEKIKKWDGRLPTVQGSGSTIISLPEKK